MGLKRAALLESSSLGPTEQMIFSKQCETGAAESRRTARLRKIPLPEANTCVHRASDHESLLLRAAHGSALCAM